MNSTRTIDNGALPATPAGGSGHENGEPGERPAGRLSEGGPGALPDFPLEVKLRPRPSAAFQGPKVLSARQFEGFLERERSLADRGTRRFSLLVLRDHVGEAKRHRDYYDPLEEFARQLCKCLRSIDLVGRLGSDRVEVLLTDTEPAGARIVAARVEQVEAELGLRLERTIYVYPAYPERTAGTSRNGQHQGHYSSGTGNGRHHAKRNGKANGNGATRASDSLTTNGTDVESGHPPNTGLGGPASGRVAAGAWPIEDLWPLLAIPTPLWKRSLDVLVSGLALLALIPLLVLIAVAIRLDSVGPLIFRQMRAGRSARPFVFYKFRSMTANADQQRAALADQNEQDGPVFKIRNDPRITRVGRFLRRWSIDELPQLWNVFKGDISLVGPRSPTFDEVCEYERWQNRRLCIIGGITCFWQVSGRSEISFREWMRLDMRYVACRSLWIDLRLLMRTLPAVFFGRGAC
jgi:lipopolysaccharide/colanic/teichoic acid biosynthesis glycosyltransferase